jgi:serine/threonine protein kinase
MPRDEVGYEMIDHEILAGLQLARQVGSGRYPPELGRLVGYRADGTEPFALVEPYRGIPVTLIAGKLLTGDRRRFEISLLTGLRWLQAAGIAHRGIGPNTVRWDEQSRSAQITDFALATIFGAPRQAVGTTPWAAPEQRLGRADGEVTDRDDIWAAGRLIFYVITGEEPADREVISAEPELAQLLAGVFGPPEDRPSCRDMLVGRLNVRDPVPPRPAEDPVLARGRAEFWDYHSRKHSVTGSATSVPAAQAGTAARRRRRITALWSGLVGVLVLAVIIHLAGG